MGGIYSEEARPRLKLTALEIEAEWNEDLLKKLFFIVEGGGI